MKLKMHHLHVPANGRSNAGRRKSLMTKHRRIAIEGTQRSDPPAQFAAFSTGCRDDFTGPDAASRPDQ
jgi:hypothetical protein